MTDCFIVFTEPGDVFQGVHHTVDGAAHNAAGLGASAMPDGAPLTVDAIALALRDGAVVSFPCISSEGFSAVRIERHAVVL